MQRWEYRFFNADASRTMATLEKIGDEGWEAFSLESCSGVSGEHIMRIYAKRAKTEATS